MSGGKPIYSILCGDAMDSKTVVCEQHTMGMQ
jgi:hypothetical protein